MKTEVSRTYLRFVVFFHRNKNNCGRRSMTVELTVVCKPQHSPVIVVVNYNSKSLTIVYNQRRCGVNNDKSNNIINYNTIQFHRFSHSS